MSGVSAKDSSSPSNRTDNGIRLVVCFVVLPFLPLAGLLLSPGEDVPIVRDRAGVAVVAAVIAVAIAAVIGWQAGWRRVNVVVCSLLSGALGVVQIFAFFMIVLTIHCSGGDTSGAC
jgi:hypothetical protein